MPIEMNSLFPQNRTHYYLFPRLLMFLGQNHFPLQATLFSFPLHFIYFVFVVCDCGCVCVCVCTLMWRSEDSSQNPFCTSMMWDPGCQAWEQAPFPTALLLVWVGSHSLAQASGNSLHSLGRPWTCSNLLPQLLECRKYKCKAATAGYKLLLYVFL